MMPDVISKLPKKKRGMLNFVTSLRLHKAGLEEVEVDVSEV